LAFAIWRTVTMRTYIPALSMIALAWLPSASAVCWTI
jgi:hypothetical protein